MENRGQYSMVNSEMLVRESHLYRKLEKLISFKKIAYRLKKLTDEGYGKERIFKMMLVQYIEDLSDREMERYLQENVAAKYFCGFSLTDKTPDYTSYSKMRARIGASQLSKIFNSEKTINKARVYRRNIYICRCQPFNSQSKFMEGER